MDAEWTNSPVARRILMHRDDHRPAWLWSHDGTTLLWRNAAARLFNAKIKKHGLKLSADAVPIKGQVSRLIRLGSIGRSSLSRVQFLAGDRPVAETCSCTPLALPDGVNALLLVGVDPIATDIREAAGDLGPDYVATRLFPDVPADAPTIETVRADEGIVAEEPDLDRDLSDMPEPMLPLGIAPLAPTPLVAPPEGDHWVEPTDLPAGTGVLSSLFDRLADDADLYSPLSAADEVFAGAPVDFGEPVLAIDQPEPPAEFPVEAIEPPAPRIELDTPIEPPPAPTVEAPPTIEPTEIPAETQQPDLIAAVIEYADDPETSSTPAEPDAPIEPTEQRTHWMITGRGFRRIGTEASETAEPPVEPAPPVIDTPIEPPVLDMLPTEPAAPLAELPPPVLDEIADPETAERVSRYNFEELGRILTDRVATEPRLDSPSPTAEAATTPPSGIINLNAETLVLNRLPLAILVFRDQHVLFANRALTDLLGHDSVESLRAAGIASIFPTEDNASAGPVNRLVRRDGMPLPVAARLQSVSWQGRAALMLSANQGEPVRNHEAAVRAFAEMNALVRNEGFVVADRAGIVTQISAFGRQMLGKSETDIVGKPLSAIVDSTDLTPLRDFLEKAARFAETARPHLLATSADGETDVVLFAEGQAGIVSGYFGTLKKRVIIAPAAGKDDNLEPGLLGRLSRGIRRPLNTIIGFADLIRSASAAEPQGSRNAEYARDIRTAGLEIAVLADELDDFTRLRDGHYAPRPSDVELSALLESCIVRVRSQASAARVLVRSAISEKLPRIHADRQSLGQALLNLLASAIDQTPIGGSVILSAQAEDDGGIAIHVRDGAQNGVDFGERFVVFRDGVDKDGEQLAPVRSSVGLALTRSLLAVNACSLSVDPTIGTGTLFSLLIPSELVAKA